MTKKEAKVEELQLEAEGEAVGGKLTRTPWNVINAIN
jgi:hypothetical protein